MNLLECPKCRQSKAKCVYLGDLGGVDYVDYYELTCAQCGFKNTAIAPGGSPIQSYGEHDPTEPCPYCKHTYRTHRDHETGSMIIHEVQRFPDKIQVDYRLQKPSGIPDEQRSMEILYSQLSEIPSIPDQYPRFGIIWEQETYWTEEVFIPGKGIVTLLFGSFQENSRDSNEHALYGTYFTLA